MKSQRNPRWWLRRFRRHSVAPPLEVESWILDSSSHQSLSAASWRADFEPMRGEIGNIAWTWSDTMLVLKKISNHGIHLVGKPSQNKSGGPRVRR